MHPKLLCLENIGKTKNFASPETSQNHVQNFGTDFGADIGQQVGQTFAASCGQTLFSIWGITCIIRLRRLDHLPRSSLDPHPNLMPPCTKPVQPAASQPVSQSTSQPAREPAQPSQLAGVVSSGLFDKVRLPRAI